MSSNQSGVSPAARPKWAAPLVGFVLLAAAFMLSNRSGEVRSPTGLPVISDPDSYNRALDEAKSLALGPLQDYELGKQLTDKQTDAIRKATVLLDTANQFHPATVMSQTGASSFAPLYLAGKAHAAIGEYIKADQLLRQGINNAEIVKRLGQLTPQGELATMDAHFERARVLFQLRDYQQSFAEATVAVNGIPKSPECRMARAKAALQLGNSEQAQEDIKAALLLDPSNHEALMYKKFLAKKA